MKNYKVDAEIAISEAVTADISVTFQAENIEAALEMSKELLGDLIKDNEITIYRIDEIVVEEEEGE